MITRRNFIGTATGWLGATLLWPVVQACRTAPVIPGSIVGQASAHGHQLRTMKFDAPTETLRTDSVIVGGGAAGLSAARYLHSRGIDFKLLELQAEPGGNAAGGQNAVSAYPWGAHYLPLPNTHDTELTHFLEECNVITGYSNDLPVFNDYYLCFDPKERLYIHHYWQEGLVPREGVPQADRDELERFHAMMTDYKAKRGHDGREAFVIPATESSQDPEFLALDVISMDDFLTQQGFKSPYLRWYVAYCCADDYGAGLRDTSAWAGIHYFASRKGKAANAPSDAVLTWPEGNGWLIRHLRDRVAHAITCNALVYSVQPSATGVTVVYHDAARNASVRIEARKAILATPQFVNQRLLHGVSRNLDYQAFHYAPWMVANLTTTSALDEKHGEPVSWDNVLYGSTSLGYVNASHQHVALPTGSRVLTFYKPLLGSDTAAIRKDAYSRKYEHWRDSILNELKGPHPMLNHDIQQLDVWLWGHAMVRPEPGFMWGANRRQAETSLANRIYFAHSDTSGLSIFEEAFYHGHRAAREASQA